MVPLQLHRPRAWGAWRWVAGSSSSKVPLHRCGRPPPRGAPGQHLGSHAVDTSRVAAGQRPVIASLTALFNSCTPLANNPGERVRLCKHRFLCSFPVKKRKLNLHTGEHRPRAMLSA